MRNMRQSHICIKLTCLLGLGLFRRRSSRPISLRATEELGNRSRYGLLATESREKRFESISVGLLSGFFHFTDHTCKAVAGEMQVKANCL